MSATTDAVVIRRRTWQRAIWLLAGLASLAAGIVGIFVPLLPTTPLVLLAAFCFSRGCSRCERWLLAHPHFGPMVRDWRERRAVPLRAKQLATVMMGTALLMFIAAFFQGDMRSSLETTLRLNSGHLQVRDADYDPDKLSVAWEYLIENPQQLQRRSKRWNRSRLQRRVYSPAALFLCRMIPSVFRSWASIQTPRQTIPTAILYPVN